MKKDAMLWLFLLPVVLFPLSSEACLWDSSINTAFLNANPASVCINAPADVDRYQHFAEFRDAEAHIRESIRTMSQQTSLNFSIQQDYCETSEEALRQPQIRITLDATAATGRALAQEEDFPHLQTNIFLPYLPQDDGRTELTIDRRQQGNFLFLTQHEILHLFGIQHDDRNLAGANDDKRREHNPEFIELSEEPAEVSIMNILPTEQSPLMRGENMRENMGLMPEDIHCIDTVLATHQQRNSSPGLITSETVPASTVTGIE